MKFLQTAFCSLMLTAAATSLQAANFYKWTDENGVVHYSERAPQGKEAEIVTTQTPRSAPPAAAPVAGEKKEGEQTAAESATPQVVKKDSAVCARAQKDLQVLISKPIVRQNGKVMTVEEKNKAIQELQEIISVHCP